MKRLHTVSCALAACAVLLAAPREARALGPIDLEAGGKVGVGTNPQSGGINPYGLGFGARAGVALLGSLYGGVSFVDYLGSSQSGVSEHALLYGIEAGFGIKLFSLVIRPQIGLGNASYSSDLGSSSHLYVEPGVTGLIYLDTLYLGADVNALVVPSVDQGLAGSTTLTSMTVHGQVGVHF
jgi:hypothetical protein